MWLIEQRQAAETGFDAPDDNLEQAIAYLGRMRWGSARGFVFIISDFLVPPPLAARLDVGARCWDVVVVSGHPVREQSFRRLVRLSSWCAIWRGGARAPCA